MVPPEIRVLVLNDDFSVINVIGWKTAVKRQFCSVKCEHCKRGYIREYDTCEPCPYCNGKGTYPKAQVIEYYDISFKDSANRVYYVPAVIANRHHAKRIYKKVPFSRHNIFRRDKYFCQLCYKQFPREQLTLDHVVPRSKWKGPGTPTCWTNIVTACKKCNITKNNRTPEKAGMELKRLMIGSDKQEYWVSYKRPKQPTQVDLILGLNHNIVNMPKEWQLYLGKM